MGSERSGQSVARMAALLRAVAVEPSGASTTEIAHHAQVPRPTAHRMLVALAAEGFVDRDEATGRWALGPELYLLSAGASSRYDIADDARDLMDVLARESGESVFLSARRGDQTVCVIAREGSFPLRSHVLHEGKRFPLGIASAGLAILSQLGDSEVDDYLARVDLRADFGEDHAPEVLRERISRTRRAGYAVNPGLIVEGSWGMGAAVFDGRDRPEWALSLTGVQTRFGSARQRVLGALLLDAAHALTVRLRGGRSARRR